MKLPCVFLYHKIPIIIFSISCFVSSALLRNSSPGSSTSESRVRYRHSVRDTWRQTLDGGSVTKGSLIIGHNEIRSVFRPKLENEKIKYVSSYITSTTEAEIQNASVETPSYVTRGSNATTSAGNKIKFILFSGELDEMCGLDKRCSVKNSYCSEDRCRCLSGYTQKNQQCIKEYTEEKNKSIKTVMIGVVILLCVMLICLFTYLCKK
ncbi:uncharacterized protein LOC111087187 [Limulus polyphemus]|uniref:Uncharacterized protein LOC111087187 n=1 Tax=Limulus polyphemus TaxID=6850 RepID=A0ABM1SYJ3_LIMPO|nr:uncharacterized protein LOC111087187 [Limulus polyphemus]